HTLSLSHTHTHTHTHTLALTHTPGSDKCHHTHIHTHPPSSTSYPMTPALVTRPKDSYPCETLHSMKKRGKDLSGSSSVFLSVSPSGLLSLPVSLPVSLPLSL